MPTKLPQRSFTESKEGIACQPKTKQSSAGTLRGGPEQGQSGRHDEMVAPAYVDHDPTNRNVRGPKGAKRLVATYRTAYPDTRFTIEEQVAEGDKVVTRWTARGTHKGELRGIAPTGKRITVTGISIPLGDTNVGVRFIGPTQGLDKSSPYTALAGSRITVFPNRFPADALVTLRSARTLTLPRTIFCSASFGLTFAKASKLHFPATALLTSSSSALAPASVQILQHMFFNGSLSLWLHLPQRRARRCREHHGMS
ncbi:MAG: ester cyclase [Deltaproteobacteria bacterium]|nr:ester cyclase [Deltaproteobacteria bacterium]